MLISNNFKKIAFFMVQRLGGTVERPDCSDTKSKFTHRKWAVPYYMFKKDRYPDSVSGVGYMVPMGNGNVTSCLYHKGLETPYLFLDDVFVTGLARTECGLRIRNNPNIHPMGTKFNKKILKKNMLHGIIP